MRNKSSKSLVPITGVVVLIISLIFSSSAYANSNKPDNPSKPNPSANSNAGGNSNGNSSNRGNSNSQNNNPSASSAENVTSNSLSNPSVSGTITGNKNINSNVAGKKDGTVTGTSIKSKNVVNENRFKVASLLKGQANKKRVNKQADRVKFPKSDPNCGEPMINGNSKKPQVRGKAKNFQATGETVKCLDYLVVFTTGTSQAQANNAAASINAQVKRNYNSVIKASLIHANPNKISALANNPRVQFVEQDARVSIANVQSNPSWGLDRIDQRDLPLSGTYDDLDNTGSNIPVFIVDTGIYAAHSDFENRVTPGFTAISDGRGSNDCNGHGTHVAGTVGGKQFGVAKTVTLVPVRVLDCGGSGTYSGVIAGLDWIATNHPSNVSAVVNMSLGGSASSALDLAVENLVKRKISVVVAAGNSNADACRFSPARVPVAITVGATQSNDARASYSNVGSCLDLFAPGSSISSAWIGSPTAVETINGTSMASPHVAGIAARLLASSPGLSPAEVESSIRSGATPNVVTNSGNRSPNLLAYSLITPTSPVDGPTTEPKPTKPSKGNAKGKSKNTN